MCKKNNDESMDYGNEKKGKAKVVIKKTVISLVIAGVVAGSIFLAIAGHNYDRVDKAIKIQGVSASDESLNSIAESIGTIDGKWVKFYYNTNPEYRNKVLTIGNDRIAGKAIDANNNMKDRRMIVYLDDTYIMETDKCKFDIAMFSDREKDSLVPIRDVEEVVDQELVFAPDKYVDGEEHTPTCSYQLVDKNNG